MPGEARQLRRGLARAEATLLALESLKEKAREEQDRRKQKDLEKERKRLEKELEREERQQEDLRRAQEYIDQRRAAEEAAAQGRAAAAPNAAAPVQARNTNAAAPPPVRKDPLPSSASHPAGVTSSASAMINLLRSAAVKTVEAFKDDKIFAATLAPLLPPSPTAEPVPAIGAPLLAFAASCIIVLHKAYAVGRAYPPSAADEANAVFAGE